ncbi:hypothetical protein CDAR_575461, partial [Caerostris darwini]
HSLSTPSVHEKTMGRQLKSSERKMFSIQEMSSSASEMRHSDTEINLSKNILFQFPSYYCLALSVF